MLHKSRLTKLANHLRFGWETVNFLLQYRVHGVGGTKLSGKIGMKKGKNLNVTLEDHGYSCGSFP